MGTSAGIPTAFLEEPLSATQENRRERPRSVGEDRDSRQPHDRGCAMGLPSDDSIQELNCGDHVEPRRRGANEPALARARDLQARGTEALRDPAGTLEPSGE